MTLPTAPSRTMSQDTFDSTTDAFIGALPQFETDMNTLAAAMTLNATIATSATSNSVGAGSKSFTATTGKSFWPGMWLLVADTAAASTNYMLGNVTSYNSSTGALVFNSLYYQGSGTKTAWSISQSGPSAFGATIGVGNATPAATGGGVTFPATQSASSDANTLDDYEEGTWTPALTGVTSIAYTSRAGAYTKNGDIVTGWYLIQGTWTASGASTVTGLPFTSNASAVLANGWGGIITFQDIENAVVPSNYIGNNSAVITLYKLNALSAAWAVPTAGTNKFIIGVFSYKT